MFNAIKKILFLITVFALLFNSAPIVLAQEKLKIYFFYGDGCPHCAKEEIFLDKLEKEYGNKIEIYRYEVWHNQDNGKLLREMAGKIKYNVTGVPVTIIGSSAITGYESDETTGKQIKSLIGGKKQVIPEKIKVPFFGEITIKDVSLPVFSIIVGFIDGFNPCAMWVLIFLIGLLLSLHNRKRMAIIGASFLIASALFYFLILNAWLNLLLFLNYIQWIKFAIGAAGIIAGIFQLKEYKKNKEGVCKVTRSEGRKKIFERIKELTRKESLWLALGGVVLLAISVNMVELVCSLGLPVVFTQVLALSNLPAWQHYFYIFIYIFFFMIDDMLVFALALFTLQTKTFSTKYSRYSSLVGGLIMIIIGILLVFKPSWIMFG